MRLVTLFVDAIKVFEGYGEVTNVTGYSSLPNSPCTITFHETPDVKVWKEGTVRWINGDKKTILGFTSTDNFSLF